MTAARRRVDMRGAGKDWTSIVISLDAYEAAVSAIHDWFEGPESVGLFACGAPAVPGFVGIKPEQVEFRFEDHRVAMDFRLRFG